VTVCRTSRQYQVTTVFDIEISQRRSVVKKELLGYQAVTEFL